MDPVTQGALGAAFSQAILHPYGKRYAWLIGAAAGMAADLDIFIRSNQDPLILLLYHRHFTHSIFFAPLGGLLVGLAFLLFKPFRKKVWVTLAAALIGYATHGLLDVCTSYGTVLFWPFSMQRISLDWIGIVNAFFTIPLILGVMASTVFDTRKGAVYGLIISGLYLILCIIQHQRAINTADEYAVDQHWHVSHLRALPEIESSRHWKIIAKTEHKIWIAQVYVPFFNKGRVIDLGKFNYFDENDFKPYQKNLSYRAFSIFNWFTEGYLIKTSSDPLTLVDARYTHGRDPIVSMWGIQLLPNQRYAKRVSNVPLSKSDS